MCAPGCAEVAELPKPRASARRDFSGPPGACEAGGREQPGTAGDEKESFPQGTPLPPVFFGTADSKGLRFCVSAVE